MICHTKDHRFIVQQISRQVWEKATVSNAVADCLAGHQNIVELFLETRSEPVFKVLQNDLAKWSTKQLQEYVSDVKGESLSFLALMLTGACNADCKICFTDRRLKAGELEPEYRRRSLQQARQLGARFVYIPGEGEPTLDSGFWHLLETCRDLELPVIIFTNGIILSDPTSCERFWGVTPDTAIRRLLDYPVSFYFKLWSTRPNLVAEMMNVSEKSYHYTSHDGVLIPSGLDRLLQTWPRDRVGIEIVVERRNVDEVLNELVPFANKHHLSRIIEMIQHNGRVFGNGGYDLSTEQAQRVLPFLSPTSCMMATCKAVITSRGFLSPRIGILEHQIPGIAVNVRSGALFELLHDTSYLVNNRYDIKNCLCETIPMSLAGTGKSTVQCHSTNVEAPGYLLEGNTSGKLRMYEPHAKQIL